jgi:DNA-binding beta-propeller fold protein YncE
MTWTSHRRRQMVTLGALAAAVALGPAVAASATARPMTLSNPPAAVVDRVVPRSAARSTPGVPTQSRAMEFRSAASLLSGPPADGGPINASDWGERRAGRRIPVGASPQLVALNRTTRTLYVTNSNAANVSVVNAAACNARRHSGCDAAAATVAVGTGPLGVAVNERTNTVYVANVEDGTVSVIDGAACNARQTAGCAHTPALVTVSGGGTLRGVAVNDTTNTIYVGNLNDTVAVIDGVTCNRSNASGCGLAPRTIAAGPGPAVPTVDEATDTIYVKDEGDGSGTTMSVIDGSTCNANTTTGCGQTPATVSVGSGPGFAVVDDVTHTVYVGNLNDGTVSVVDTANCNGRDRSGCGQSPPTAPVGSAPQGLALDTRAETLYVVNSNSDTLSAVDVADCSARDASGCARHAPTIQVGQVPVGGIALDPRTRTLYVPDSLDNDVFVFNARSCNAAHSWGCRHEATSVVTNGSRDLAVDAAVHTLYVTQPGSDSVALIDTRVCNAGRLRGCRRTPVSVPLGNFPVGIVIDSMTNTIYLNNMGDNTVSVIDAATCNVSDLAGCVPLAPPIPVGGGNAELAINETTHTVYVADGADNTVAVIDARRCNATTQTGCSQTPARVTVGENPRRVGIDTSTNTIYVSNYGGGSGSTISVIDGSSCDAATTTGCGQTPPTITVGLGPQGLVVDKATHTLYVANQAADDAPGTLSIVDAATCNATDTVGCGQTPPTTATGLGPRALALDPANHTVYTANVGDASSSIVDGAACNAINHTRCDDRAPRIAVGDAPTDTAFDTTTGTVYVADAVATPPATSIRGIVSVF